MQALVKKSERELQKTLVLRSSLMLIAALIVLGSCSENPPYPSVSTIAGEWLAIKMEIPPSLPSVTGIEKKIENFRTTLDRFFTSPVGSLYQVHRPEEIRSIAAIGYAAERLQIAVLNGEKEAGELIKLEIDSYLDQLQRIDESLSATSQRHYFQLFFFFTVLVIAVVLSSRLLYSRLQKAENREQQSLEFSREIVIAQEQERERIARELHDTVAQDLWRLLFQTDLISKSEDTLERNRLCTEVYNSQNELMIRVRDICDNLIPPDFQYRRLEGALQKMCYSFEQRTKIECRITIQDNLQLGSLSIDNQLQCYRIVQECLANVEKHSQATVAPIVIRNNTETELLIIVSDNGKGFEAPDRDSCKKLKEQKHYGLWSIYERTASLNGILVIDSEAGEGTPITLRVSIKGET
jgi:signal transduction histidine kinase